MSASTSLVPQLNVLTPFLVAHTCSHDMNVQHPLLRHMDVNASESSQFATGRLRQVGFALFDDELGGVVGDLTGGADEGMLPHPLDRSYVGYVVGLLLGGVGGVGLLVVGLFDVG